MSASNPTSSTVLKVFNKLSYEPVLDSDSAVKSWIASHNSGVFAPIINNEYVNVNSEQLKSFFVVKNPYNDAPLAKIVNCDGALVNMAIDSCRASFEAWKSMSFIQRGKFLYNIARNIQKNAQIFTSCESLNSGRTSREVKDLDVAALIKTFYYYAGATGFSASVDLDSYEALGVVAIFGYYDSSLLSLANKLAAALATGNTCLVLPHHLTPLSAYLLLDICKQSGIPSGVINLIVSEKEDLYKQISIDNRINCISFDGRASTAQDQILSQSFANPNKRTLFSLEGKASMAIYESADIDSAIECIVDGCFYSNGQHRYSLNKVFVQECVYEDFLKRLETRFAKLRVGNHLDKCNDLGPIFNSAESREKLTKPEHGVKINQFTNTIEESSTKNSLVAPTIITNVALNSSINLNEINGPYVILIQFRTVKESVELINTSKYGSAVSLHSQNISLVMEVANLVNVGTVWINSISIERGVQVRKFSGNYSNNGQKSLMNFLKPKYEKYADSKQPNLEELKKEFKTVGSLNPAAAVPIAQNLTCEKTYKLYIGGKQARSDTQSSAPVYLPSNELYCLVADASRKDVRNAVEAACSSFNSWSKRANHNKSQILYFFGENFNTRKAEFIGKLELLTKKSRAECENEFELCSDIIFYFASVCDKYTGRLNDSTEYGFLMEINEPLGCIAILCGHNAYNKNPLLSFILHLLPAIAYGNTVVIVPDEKCPILALDLYEIFETSDMPDGVINILSGNKHHLAKYLCEHQQVNALWYLNDMESETNVSKNELIVQQFIKFTSSHSLKQVRFLNGTIPLDEKSFIDKTYLQELFYSSTQNKYIQIPIGVIFAN